MAEQFDFLSIKQRILNNLSSKTEHQNIFDNGAIVNIIEALAEELEDEMLEDEYLTTENNWALAQNKSSLLTESKVHNYLVPRKRGATGYIRFGVSDDFLSLPDAIVDFPKWTQTSTSTGIDFTTINSASLNTTEAYIDILSVQGIHKTFTNFAQGIPNETFILNNDSVENSYFELYVNEVLWTPVESLFDYGNSDTVYELRSLVDFSGVKIEAGDGTHGKILANGDTLRFEYVETQGTNGNVVANNLVTNVDSSIYDINLGQVEVFCTNISSLAGGESEASLEEIRNDSPKVFQSGDRATVIADYETIINGFSYIKKVSITGAYEYNLDNGNDLWAYIPTQDNLLNVIALTTTNEGLSLDQCIQLTEDIHNKNAPTDILNFPAITIIPMVFNMDVAVNSRAYTLNQVKANIDTNLEDAYNIDKLEFFESIYDSDFVALIDNTLGVRKHSSYATLLNNLDFTSAYALSIDLPLFPIIGTYIKIYVKLKSENENAFVLIGTSTGDVDGFIVGEVGYTFTELSRIVPTTGVGSIGILEGLEELYTDYDVRIEYRLEDDDIILTDRSQILEYNSSRYLNIEYYKGGK